MDGKVKHKKIPHIKRKNKKGKGFKQIKPRIGKRLIEEKELENLETLYKEYDFSGAESFEDFPVSSKTKKGLSENDYKIPTEIQRECIGLALKGFDVLGAAKTGSGKTLAFLIPVLEILYKKKWTKLDGLGALIITPTRELALQIYETLCKVGKYHDFSGGLIIGGKDLVFEKSRMHLVNIIICTPGRLLQHMDENPLFDCVNTQVLVLDEADRCMDLGFEHTMNCIIENLPKSRQTLLFSATQTKSVKDLVRLSLKDPKYVSVHEHAKHKTPEGLTQSYMVSDQHEKMAVLWSFIQSHLKQKVIVFMSTCNQVKYTYDILCKLHPRTTLLALHGKLHQLKRMNIYHTFCRKQHAFLFATDIAARGLDFPEVNWVIQVDCPEDVETYIHRAGRTARYQKGGECLLLLRPCEIQMVENLTSNRIPITEIKVNPARLFSPHAKIEAHLAKDPDLKASAQRAFVSYARAVHLMKDKSIFDVRSIDNEKYARSLGLVVTPRIRFLQKFDKNKQEKKKDIIPENNALLDKIKEKSESDSEEIDDPDTNITPFGADIESEDDVLVIKRKYNFDKDDESDTDLPEPVPKKKKTVITKVALAKRALKKKIIPNKKILFTEEGEAIMNKMRERVTDVGRDYEADVAEGGIDIEKAKEVMKEEDKWDRQLFKEKVKAKRREKKRKLKELRKQERGEPISSDESEPDLSWLPDPDKVYNKNESDTGDSEEEQREEISATNPSREDFSDSDVDDTLTLKEQEELALKFLSSK